MRPNMFGQPQQIIPTPLMQPIQPQMPRGPAIQPQRPPQVAQQPPRQVNINQPVNQAPPAAAPPAAAGAVLNADQEKVRKRTFPLLLSNKANYIIKSFPGAADHASPSAQRRTDRLAASRAKTEYSLTQGTNCSERWRPLAEHLIGILNRCP